MIDLGLEWSTFFGGTLNEFVHDSALTSAGDIVIVGSTRSADLPVSPDAFDQAFGGGIPSNAEDGFVSEFSPQGELRFSTYLGGSGFNDRVMGVDVAADGTIVVGGTTSATDFPVTVGSFDQVKSGTNDGFVSRLSPDGSQLLHSTFLGGSKPVFEEVREVKTLPSGEVVCMGITSADDFPTTLGAFDTDGTGVGTDAFVTRFDPQLSTLVYSTFLGSDLGNDNPRALAVSADEGAVVVGTSFHPDDHPATPGVFMTAHDGYYVTRLTADGSGLVFSTPRIGGSFEDTPTAVALDPLGNIVIVGRTYSGDYPVTVDAFDPTGPGSGLPHYDGFVTVLDPTGTRLVQSTFLGALDDDYPQDVAVDPAGAIVVAGLTFAPSFPTTPGAFDETISPPFFSNADAFLTRFSPDGSRLHYSTFLGGSDHEGSPFTTRGLSLALDPWGSAIVATYTLSEDYPVTPGAAQPTLAGPHDAVITKLDMLPRGVERHGTSTPGCQGPLIAGVTAMPQAGLPRLGVTCANAPPQSVRGLLVVASRALDSPVTSSGAAVWLDPRTVVAVLPASSDKLGYAEVLGTVPATPGLTANVQFFWPDACAAGGWSASTGLSLTVQP